MSDAMEHIHYLEDQNQQLHQRAEQVEADRDAIQQSYDDKCTELAVADTARIIAEENLIAREARVEELEHPSMLKTERGAQLEAGLKIIADVLDYATDSSTGRQLQALWVKQAVQDVLDGKPIVTPRRG